MWFKYCVVFFDEEYDEHTNKGIVYAEDEVEAVRNIYGDYGKDQIIGLALYRLETECKTMTTNDITNAMKDMGISI